MNAPGFCLPALATCLLATSAHAAKREAVVDGISVTVQANAVYAPVVVVVDASAPTQPDAPSPVAPPPPSLKAASWLAATAASRAVGKDVANTAFTVKLVNAPITADDPPPQLSPQALSSSSLLLASAMASLMLGYSVRPDAAIIGVVTPDGSALAVAGAAGIARAAADAGVKLIGVVDPDADVRALQVLGVTIVDVDNIDDGVALLTGGKHLPSVPSPLEAKEMRRTANEQQRLALQLAATRAAINSVELDVKQALAAAAPVMLPSSTHHIESALADRDAHLAKAVDYERRNELDDAQLELRQAAASLSKAQMALRILPLQAEAKYDDVVAAAHKIEADLVGALNYRYLARSAAGLVYAIDVAGDAERADSSGVTPTLDLERALAQVEQAQKAGDTTAVKNAVGALVAPALISGDLPGQMREVDRMWADLDDSGKNAKHPEKDDVVARSYALAAQAALDAVVDNADDVATAKDAVARALASDATTSVAYALRAYLLANRLVLGVPTHAMADRARKAALASAARAKKSAGQVPSPCKRWFLVGDAAENDDDEATTSYWNAMLLADYADGLMR